MDTKNDHLDRQEAILKNKEIELRQQVRYLCNDYKYHHKNNEILILEEAFERIKRASMEIRKTLEMRRFLCEKLSEAKVKCVEADRLLSELRLDCNESSGLEGLCDLDNLSDFKEDKENNKPNY